MVPGLSLATGSPEHSRGEIENLLMIWTFSDSIRSDRLEYLRSLSSYCDIVNLMKDEASEVIAYPEEGNAGGQSPSLKNCFRPSFQFSVTPRTGDLFFNSSNGYRAAYCKSVASGTEANRLVIDALMPKLLDAWRKKKPKFHNEQWADRALRHYSAKIWIYEGLICCHEWIKLDIEIENPIWIATANRTDPEDSRLPYWGVRAPIADKLEVKGAWIDPDGEFRTGKSPDKRASDIRCQGWS